MKEKENIKISDHILKICEKVPEEGLVLNDLLDLIGDYGIYFTTIILLSPFLFPVSFPGSSSIFGSVIILLNINIFFQDAKLLPKRFKNYHLTKKSINKLLKSIIKVVSWFEKISKPRLMILSTKDNIKYINTIIILILSFLLILPLPIPLTDFFPAYCILMIVLGTMEKDGYILILGYALTIFTIFYFSTLGFVGVDIIKKVINWILSLKLF